MITLAMIVRNEEHVIERCLASAKPFIDHWIVVDTGSKDATRDIVEAFMADVPGKLYRREWVNFGHNRNELLRLANPTGDYLLLLDADDVLFEKEEQPEKLGKGMYDVTIFDGSTYTQPRLIHTSIGAKYTGVTHEYLHATGAFTRAPLYWWDVRHYCDGSRRPVKFTEDEQLLRLEYAKNPHDERTVFYLARTLHDLGKHDEAIRFYEMRSRMGGWEGEARHAARQAAQMRDGNYTPLGVPS